MLQALLITFREGLESFLIVGVILTYLRRTGRTSLVRGVHVGIGLSVFTSAIGAYLWLQVPNQPLYEGIAAIVAAVLVGGLLWQMVRTGRRLKEEIELRVDKAAGTPDEKTSLRAKVGIALLTCLLITREGLEAVFFLGVQAFAAKATMLVIGGVVGLLLAGGLAWFWSRYSHKLQLGVILRVTAFFLALFLVQLLVYGVHELAESGVIEGSQAFHDATERFGPHGDIGEILSYSLFAAPLLYVILSRRNKPRMPRPSNEAAA